MEIKSTEQMYSNFIDMKSGCSQGTKTDQGIL